MFWLAVVILLAIATFAAAKFWPSRAGFDLMQWFTNLEAYAKPPTVSYDELEVDFIPALKCGSVPLGAKNLRVPQAHNCNGDVLDVQTCFNKAARSAHSARELCVCARKFKCPVSTYANSQ